MERFDAWENSKKAAKPKKNIQECRKARRKLRVFNKPDNFITRKSRSFFLLQPEKSKLERTVSCPNFNGKTLCTQDIQENNLAQKTYSKALFSTSESSISGRKFAVLKPSPIKSKSCCCSEHVILHLNLKYFTENSKSVYLKKWYNDFENLEGFSRKEEVKPKKSQSFIFLPVCDPECLQKHQIPNDKFSFVKRVKHFICCCVKRSISQSNLESFIEPPATPA